MHRTVALITRNHLVSGRSSKWRGGKIKVYDVNRLVIVIRNIYPGIPGRTMDMLSSPADVLFFPAHELFFPAHAPSSQLFSPADVVQCRCWWLQLHAGCKLIGIVHSYTPFYWDYTSFQAQAFLSILFHQFLYTLLVDAHAWSSHCLLYPCFISSSILYL